MAGFGNSLMGPIKGIAVQQATTFASAATDQIVTPVGLAMRFEVVVGGLPLGHWSACKGLQADFGPHRFREQGNQTFEQILYGEIKYSAITLERVMTEKDSAILQTWLRYTLDAWIVNPAPYVGNNATIALLDRSGSLVTKWELRRVYPSKWIGPTLSAKENAVAIETLELVHEGFL
jgi:phage tail-like protein